MVMVYNSTITIPVYDASRDEVKLSVVSPPGHRIPIAIKGEALSEFVKAFRDRYRYTGSRSRIAAEAVRAFLPDILHEARTLIATRQVEMCGIAISSSLARELITS